MPAARSPNALASGDPARDPLDDARALLASSPGPDAEAVARAEAALSSFHDLGPLHGLALWLAAWPGPAAPPSALRRVRRPLIAVYCASYSLDSEAPARARERLERLAAGGAAVSGMARALGAGVEAFDLAVDRPSPDPVRSPGAVMNARAVAATLAFGLEAVAKEPDLLVLTAEAEGSDLAAASLLAALAEEPDADPLALLGRCAGREAAAIAGAILAARSQRIPVLLDGAAALAAGDVLRAVRPGALDHARDARAIVPFPLDSEPGAAGAAALALVKLAGEIGAD